MANLKLSGLPQGTTLEANATIVTVQTVGSTVVNQRIPKALFFSQALASALIAANNLSDIIDPAAARENLGAGAVFFSTGAPSGSIGIIGDVAIDDAGVIYEKTGSTTWTSRIDLATGAEVTAAIAAHAAASDPHPTYLTQTEGDARYPQTSALSETIDDRVAALLVAGSNITLTYNDAAGTLTIESTASGSSLTVREVDGTPSVSASVIEVPNGSLADQGGGVVRLTFPEASSSGGASGIPYTYDEADPPTSAGQIRTLQASLNVATTVAINTADINGDSATDITERLKTDCIFTIAKDAANYVRYKVTADYAAGSVAVAVQAEQGAIATGDAVFLAIASDAPAVGGGGGGSGFTWSEITADTHTLAANTGVIANGASIQNFTVSSAAPTGTENKISGKSASIFNLIGASFIAPNGAINTGVRKLATHQYASVDLLKIAPTQWLIRHPADLTGVELYNAAAD
ncbi:MAG: hypothetical protein ACEQSC_00200, partial [Candidatus Nanopelagicaceae bacterium]